MVSQVVHAAEDLASRLVPVPLGHDLAMVVAHVPYSEIPELPDRIIAATALHLGVPLICGDAVIQASNVPTPWT